MLRILQELQLPDNLIQGRFQLIQLMFVFVGLVLLADK